VSAPVVKNRRRECPPRMPNEHFSAWCGVVATVPACYHNAGIWSKFAGFVLNVPLSSVICR
jgi:hypothetical protein